MYKLGIALLVALTSALAPLGAGAADTKIGIVDSIDILSKSPEWTSVQDRVKKKAEEMGRPLQQQGQDLQRQVQEYEKQAGMMKDDAKKRKQEELQKKMTDLQKRGQEAEKSMAQFEEKEKAPLFQKLDAAVKAVAQDQKLDVVLDKRNSGLLYMAPTTDITDKVRSKFR